MGTVELTLEEIESITRSVFASNGCDATNTEALVRTIVAAERDGAASHGLFRIPGYVASLRSGKVNGKADPVVQYRTPVFVNTDGDSGFAPLALERGIPYLCDAAETLGIAVLTITKTHHFAALWPETEAIAKRGLVGLACVCHTPVVAPFGGRQALFSTNPISFAWPRPGKDPMVFDMATSAMAHGEILLAARDGRDVPPGTGVDSDGNETTDPNEILNGVLLPFGGYKGSAIAMLVELLAAGATGDRFSFEAGNMDNADGGPAQGGEFIIAISPQALAGDGWAEHCERFFTTYDAIDGVRLPGARRFLNRRSGDAIVVDQALVENLRTLIV